MPRSPESKPLVAVLLAALGLSACAVVAGLDGFSKVDDCVDCADATGLDATTDDSEASSATCSPACSGATPTCDPTTLKCVGCLSSKECGPGFLCFDNRCTSGCSASHPECAPDAGRCDLEAGVCRTGCLEDSDCTQPGKTICDKATGQCTECLPTRDTCPTGKFCASASAGEYQCAIGCTTVNDCAALVDGGAKDGGFGTIACCNHRCVDTSSDLGFCGSCTNSCVPEGGTPGTAACCNSACYDLGTNASHCGSCTNVCSTNNVPVPSCGGSRCNGACAPGTGDCNNDKLTDGCETDTLSTVAACGGCGNVCSTNNIASPSCSGGQCNGACNPGFADCNVNKLTDGCESNLATDPLHCGGCANACSNNHIPTPTCASGACNGTCASGYVDCNNNKLFDGCEVNTGTDPNNCGGCGKVCSTSNMAMVTCNGTCNGTCASGFADCNSNKLTDGCEIRIATDPNNCGGCNVSCSSNHISNRTCGGSTCNGTCASGYADCNNNKQSDGCEVNILTDSAHCGGCGAANVCAAGYSCISGTCVHNYVESSSTQAFIDACTTGTQITGSPFFTGTGSGIDDAASAALALPFSWTYYGQAQNNFWISSNGVLGFGSPPSNASMCCGFACPLPTTSDPAHAIMVFGDDLHTRSSGLCVSVVGAAPNRKLVATWENAYLLASTTSTLQFSAILSETSNTIDLVYNTMTDTNATYLARAQGSNAVVGLQNATSTAGANYSCRTQSETSGTAIRFTP